MCFRNWFCYALLLWVSKWDTDAMNLEKCYAFLLYKKVHLNWSHTFSLHSSYIFTFILHIRFTLQNLYLHLSIYIYKYIYIYIYIYIYTIKWWDNTWGCQYNCFPQKYHIFWYKAYLHQWLHLYNAKTKSWK